MQNLTPFVRHALEDAPGDAGAPGANSTQNSPPLGSMPLQPPGPPDDPGVQLPPAPTQGQTPHPGPGSAPRGEAHGVPMTDGTPAPCRQKNAAEFLQGRSPGVMAQYAPGLFSTRQHTHSAHPAPEDDETAVRGLVEWREEAPYG